MLVNSALPAVTINAVATDDIINAAESGNAQTISGQVTGAAQGIRLPLRWAATPTPPRCSLI
ncbi:hypothetical protein SFA64_09235 [Escherichia coli]|nr:hypothetical protein [Escherichia coli]